MKYTVLMQFIPGNDQIWVSKLAPNDPEYIYDNEQDAINKAAKLQAADSTGRLYKVG
jgi:hypothetical protein